MIRQDVFSLCRTCGLVHQRGKAYRRWCSLVLCQWGEIKPFEPLLDPATLQVQEDGVIHRQSELKKHLHWACVLAWGWSREDAARRLDALEGVVLPLTLTWLGASRRNWRMLVEDEPLPTWRVYMAAEVGRDCFWDLHKTLRADPLGMVRPVRN